MTSASREISLGFSPDQCEEGCHIIYLYNDDYERKRTMARFLQQGLHEGEKVLYLTSELSPAEMKQELQALGVPVDKNQQDIDVITAHYTHCPDSCFSPDFMLEMVSDYYDNAVKQGYKGARGAGEMSWALVDGRTTVKDLLKYESSLNAVLHDHPLTTICQYDARRFDGAVILDMMSVHPMMIVRGQLVKNPYFIPSESLLKNFADKSPGMNPGGKKSGHSKQRVPG
ncbi:MAG: MEDS domain-containing protein [Spirochaetales bacterium]|nr:MEDS domain-containing protein [Spirochaetales bacterium]